MAGRYQVSFGDVRRIARAALRHRLHRSFEAESEGITNDEIARRVIQSTPEMPPVSKVAATPSRGGAA
jgi:MoxR-like ATPase